MRKLKYLLVIPDGVGIRNFFCTRFIDLLLESGEVCVWHDLPQKCIAPFQDRWERNVHWEELPPITDPVLEKLFRQSKVYAQLYWQKRKEPDFPLKRGKASSRWKARQMDLVAQLLGWACGNESAIVLLDRLHQKEAARAHHMSAYRHFLESNKPDVVFCSHQRALKAVPALAAARQVGIPTTTFIYSWDNLPKGRMPVSADSYLVWSEFMKNELLKYYPDVTPEQAWIVGTPQFENHHNQEMILSREQFFGELGMDLERPVVCFSGDDVKTSPYDPIYLADLAGALRTIPLPRRPQILFRRCPVDRSHRYDAVLKQFPEVVVSEPRWQTYGDGVWSQVVPTREDAALLVNVICHSDLVINVGSTMAMDFAAYDKPGIYIAYNPAGAEHGWDYAEVYRLLHFKTTHQLQPVYWARSAGDWADLVLHALRCPREKAEARKAWLNLHVMQPMDRACERCTTALQQIALNRSCNVSAAASAQAFSSEKINASTAFANNVHASTEP